MKSSTFLFSALDGVCHGAGGESEYDNGPPTFFRYFSKSEKQEFSRYLFLRYPVRETWTGQDREPGNSYAVLYSLQRMTGRFCDFSKYHDTEVRDRNKKWPLSS